MREELPGLADDVVLAVGDVVELTTTGGGGWGDPLERDPEFVRWDVIRGLVSDESARDDYGVVLEPGIDRPVVVAATRDLRAELARERGTPEMFDRGPRYAELQERAR
jgi:N-methylhydantoinase B